MSAFLNVLAFAYLLHRAYQYYQIKSRPVEVKTQNDVKYFLSRNEVFRKLPNDPGEIIFIGDSHTQNFELAEIFKDVRIKNRGINGDISKGVLLRLHEVTESQPLKVFIEVGINDILNGIAADSTKKNLSDIIRTIKSESPRTQIFVHSLFPTNWNAYGTSNSVVPAVADINRFIEDLSRQEHCTFINVYDDFSLNGRLHLMYDCGDSLHLNGQGYLRWSDKVRPYLQPLGVDPGVKDKDVH